MEADAVVVDLRGTRGSDPRALLPLVSRLTGRESMHPRGSIVRSDSERAQRLRQAYRERYPDESPRSIEAWRELVAPQESADKEPSDQASPPRVARPVTVLIGRECEEACEQITRTLEAAGGGVVGWVDSSKRPGVGDPGLLVLPNSGIDVHVPTTAYVLDESIASPIGFGDWSDARRQGVTREDALPLVLTGLAGFLTAREKTASFEADKPALCSSYSAVDHPDKLPASAKKRLQGDFFGGEGGSMADFSVRAYLFLSSEGAVAYAEECPDMRAISAGGGAGGTTLLLRPNSFEALSRLLQSEVVDYVVVTRAMRHVPDPVPVPSDGPSLYEF